MLSSVQVLAMLLTLATPAERPAEHEENRARAEILFKQGVSALEARRFDEAIEDYAQAYELLPTVTVLCNLALAHDLAGHKSEALANYRKLDLEAKHAPEKDLDKLGNNLVEARKRIPILEAEIAAEYSTADTKKRTADPSNSLGSANEHFSSSKLQKSALIVPAKGDQAPAFTKPAPVQGQPPVVVSAEKFQQRRWWPVAAIVVATVAVGAGVALWLGQHDCRGDFKCF